MSESSKDLFGKIDALFEKRSPDVLVDKGLDHDDFPVLTEVLARPGEKVPPRVFQEQDRRTQDRRGGDRRSEDRRQGDRRQAAQVGQADQPQAELPAAVLPGATLPDEELLAQAVESRLMDLFIRQQLRMEQAMRKLIREEIARYRSSTPPAGSQTPD
jgi:hypothetical protein